MSPVRVPISPKRIQGLYDFLSSFYDHITRYEGPSLRRALEIATIRESNIVLEVGFGTGRALIEIAKRVGNGGEAIGVDISQKMSRKAWHLIQRRDQSRHTHLLLGDGCDVPFREETFDVLFCAYVLDLIDTPRITRALTEFRRVLKPSGRLVLVSLSKGTKWYDNMKLYEWTYPRLPILFGGCRPIELSPYLQELGFTDVKVHFVHSGHLVTTEIVSGIKGAL
jgi:ubiquinone/menaquinone biosynthesis C-methylase UbiE